MENTGKPLEVGKTYRASDTNNVFVASESDVKGAALANSNHLYEEVPEDDPIPGAPMYWHDAITCKPPIDEKNDWNKANGFSDYVVLNVEGYGFAFGKYLHQKGKWYITGFPDDTRKVTHYLILKQPA